jgi:putative transposase
MTQNRDPYENAIAERINGILKVEFGLYITFRKIETAREAVDSAIKNYNTIRPHMSLKLKTPASVHQQLKLCTTQPIKEYGLPAHAQQKIILKDYFLLGHHPVN